MKLPVTCLLMVAASGWAADYETVTLSDGRVLTGYYDADQGKIDIVNGKSTVSLVIKPQDVISRIAASKPRAAVAAEQKDLLALNEARLADLKRDQDNLRANAAKYRAMAGSRTDKSEAEAVITTAKQYELEADKLTDEMTKIEKKITFLRSEKAAVVLATDEEIKRKRSSSTANEDASIDGYNKAKAKSMELQRQSQVVMEEFLAGWLRSADLNDIATPALGSDPTKSQMERDASVREMNGLLGNLRQERDSLRQDRPFQPGHVGALFDNSRRLRLYYQLKSGSDVHDEVPGPPAKKDGKRLNSQ